MTVTRALPGDIDEISRLYDTLNDYLEAGINYPMWRKDHYPTREDAVFGVLDESLFVLKHEGVIAGSVSLNHKAPEAYSEVKWAVAAQGSELLIVHTLAVHPDYQRRGIAKRLMAFAKDYAEQTGIRAIRLDTPIGNTPAKELYKKCGYLYKGTVDLRFDIPGLVWFNLFELVI